MRNIVLIEDNENDHVLIVRTLQKAGLLNPVHVIETGLDALDYCTGMNQPTTPLDAMPLLVILDLKLPDMPGLDVLKTLRSHERTAACNVIVLTGSGDFKDTMSARELGVKVFITKGNKTPLEAHQFFDALMTYEAKWMITDGTK